MLKQVNTLIKTVKVYSCFLWLASVIKLYFVETSILLWKNNNNKLIIINNYNKKMINIIDLSETKMLITYEHNIAQPLLLLCFTMLAS